MSSHSNNGNGLRSRSDSPKRATVSKPESLLKDPCFASFVTSSSQFEGIFQYAKAVAEVGRTVLIEGETGTGKEVMARIIHTMSLYRKGPFVPVNLSGISPALFEAELFGYRRGAFTGAIHDHDGYLGKATGGVLFLDEIGELHHEQQKTLLRVLAERCFCRVGEADEREIEGQIVMATNRNLHRDMLEGRCREDFYYRVSGSHFVLPPLRERPGDLELLVAHFLRKNCSEVEVPLMRFDVEAMGMLTRYRFPGNVRELDGIIAHSVLRTKGKGSVKIDPSALPEVVWNETSAERRKQGKTDYQRAKEALNACDGNRAAAAKKLGVSRATLYRWLKDSPKEQRTFPFRA